MICCSKAAKLILIGFNMMPVPSADDDMITYLEEQYTYREWQHHQLLHRLGNGELQWALRAAQFKAYYRVVSIYIRLWCCNTCDSLNSIFCWCLHWFTLDMWNPLPDTPSPIA